MRRELTVNKSLRLPHPLRELGHIKETEIDKDSEKEVRGTELVVDDGTALLAL